MTNSPNPSLFFYKDEYLDEFERFLQSVEYTDRNPLNTEMLFLWSMIRASKPELFIESGTFRGYSATFICEAMKRNGNQVSFVSMGYNLENCIPYARHRLELYRFARVVEGDSRILINKYWKAETRKTAFFVDGPKGRNMPPLFFSILRNFHNIEFIAVHDCERDSGSGNRWYLENFFGREFPIFYCGTSFQEQFSFLDKPLIGKSEISPWRPYFRNNRHRESYGTETGYVLPKLRKQNHPLFLIPFYLYRLFRFKIYLGITSLYHNRVD